GIQRLRQSGLARPRSDSDRLQHLRAVLPAEVRVTAPTHPLFGRLLAANGFKRWQGELLLVVMLPDNTPGTIRADATNVLGDGAAPAASGETVLSVEGIRSLRTLVMATRPRGPKSRGARRPAT
ncbi:MAG: hypothetical protein ACRDZY_02705, partial [Acidimicrobiales bacterium]